MSPARLPEWRSSPRSAGITFTSASGQSFPGDDATMIGWLEAQIRVPARSASAGDVIGSLRRLGVGAAGLGLRLGGLGCGSGRFRRVTAHGAPGVVRALVGNGAERAF